MSQVLFEKIDIDSHYILTEEQINFIERMST